jgi:peroxiredoxin
MAIVLGGCARPAPPAKAYVDPAPVALASAEPAPVQAPEEAAAENEPRSAQEPRAWLGVELAALGAENAGSAGVLVRGVVPGSPAERAGLTKGDVILTIDGQGVARPAEVVAIVSEHRAGERLAIALARGNQERLFAATLEPQPNDESLMKKRYVDAPAPSLAGLKTVRGSVNANLNELRGNVVIVEFWAGWCVPCGITAPLLSSWSDRYSPEGLRVLGVTSDPVVQAADAAARHGMTYAVFSDEVGTTTLSYRAFALPTLFVIDRRGIVRDVMVGFSTTRLKQIEALVERLLAER